MALGEAELRDGALSISSASAVHISAKHSRRIAGAVAARGGPAALQPLPPD
jgi:hypothetical protein